jgi:serine/threonine protein kinase
MKILNKKQIMGNNLVKYAKTERDVLTYVRHPFIVGLKYAFQTPEKLFLLLEYAPCGNMSRTLHRDKRFDEERAKVYLAEIILAIEDLHKRDIIFRDLKPDNIVFDEEGHAMLTDFGLSKEGIQNNSAARSFCGSPAYLAPEMLKRQGHGKSVDWYLLGVLLYEMLVGIPPYYSNNK